MESLSDTKWDVVISGTGLPQSLLALALSRSGKNILQVDPNDYYGGAEAALSLPEVDEWAQKHAVDARPDETAPLFTSAKVVQSEGMSLRGYTLALAPHFIHAKSELVSQLVSSKAFRQLEFLAVGSFYIFRRGAESDKPALSPIPSTREDVFSDTSIPARAKRSLMKFLKFVLDFDDEPNLSTWTPRADKPLAGFLADDFKLDSSLQSYVLTLTLSLDGKITVADGLKAINRHMTSIGVFGAGFAAVYPKWGGLSEIAQVGCRAGAVGGSTYMLGTGIKDVSSSPAQDESDSTTLSVVLDNDMTLRSRALVQGAETREATAPRLKRLTAVVASPLSSVFKPTMDEAPQPAVAIVAFPAGTVDAGHGASTYPIYAMIHSGVTGECPIEKSVIYLSTPAAPGAEALLDKALSSLLEAVSSNLELPEVIYRLTYEQGQGSSATAIDGDLIKMPTSSVSLAFDDAMLPAVQDAWTALQQPTDEDQVYMNFEDREGQADDDDVYD